MTRITLLSIFLFIVVAIHAQDDVSFIQMEKDGRMTLTESGASHFANLALSCLQQEYPNKLNQVLSDANGLQEPKTLHPAFYGCFDWHSSVHGHWMLVKLLKKYPNLPEAAEIRKKLGENLTAENIRGEVNYFTNSSKSWERMYGWSWLMKLSEELFWWDDESGKQWSANLQPLTDVIIDRYMNFLPIQQYPVRTGVHPNTAFGLSFAWDYANATGHIELKTLIETRAKDYYLSDANCPADWEPSGEDFLSACLEEAGLMQRVLSEEAFRTWFEEFLPNDKLESLLIPADVSDRSDPKIVHLDGLNLSRAWCFYRIAQTTANPQLIEAAAQHLQATVPNIASEHYEGSHWLASFVIYALEVGR